MDLSWLKNLHSAEELLHMLKQWDVLAYAVLFGIIFAETGLLAGFFFPGDSLLFVAGFAASPHVGVLNLGLLIPLLFIAAVTGDAAGFHLGRVTGPKVFKRPRSLLFHPEHIARTERYFERYGGKTIILARFVPIVRTFAPFLAGVGNMRYVRFLKFNLVGGLVWTTGIPTIGYFLGNNPWVKHNLEKAVLGIVFLSIVPMIVEVIRHKLHPPAPAEEAVREDLSEQDFR